MKEHKSGDTREAARARHERMREIAKLLGVSAVCQIAHPERDAEAFVVFRGDWATVTLVDSEVAHNTPAAIAAEIQRKTSSAHDLALLAWFCSRGASGAGQFVDDPDDFKKQAEARAAYDAWWAGGSVPS